MLEKIDLETAQKEALKILDWWHKNRTSNKHAGHMEDVSHQTLRKNRIRRRVTPEIAISVLKEHKRTEKWERRGVDLGMM
jgi:hypothetical protein